MLRGPRRDASLFASQDAGEVVIRTPTTPLTLFRPSVGVMMASVLNVYGIDTIGVLMTGIGDDGADQRSRSGRPGATPSPRVNRPSGLRNAAGGHNAAAPAW